MFNFDAEIFVILYPYAAGGRFLQMAMSLDPTITPIHSNLPTQPSFDELFNEYKLHLETTGQNNAHYKNAGHLSEYVSTNLPDADRYVFCLHQVELVPARDFLRECQNLKIFIINTSTEETFKQLRARRWFFAQRVSVAMQESYRLPLSELQTIKSVNETLKFRIGAWPVGTIELEDYWNPNSAIPQLSQFFTEHNLNCPRWEELYHIWHANAIEATLNEISSNC
jgi:hypothetical protein